MEQRVDVLDLGPHEHAVTITEGSDTTHHRVIVPEQLLDDLGLIGVDEQVLVRESMDYLLDRIPADAIPHDVDLADLAADHPDFSTEILDRLAG